ncbi:hypothetical protein HKX48_008018 [Thoreauomyces humboldtii]|nr:hypothetical protein HKX48_008018 [Thoreauomyces humboldtii]
MQLGGKAFEQAQENLNKNLNRWVNIPHLKYYFNVSNSYVLNKIRLLFFPFRHQSWIRLVRRSEHSGQAEGYEPPRRDLNAPDLYIPVMTFVTYILLVGIRLGLNDANAAGKVDPSQGINPAKVIKSFSPDVLGMTGTTAFFIVFFEVLFFKLGFYLLNVTTDVPFLDLVSYSGYKFLGVISAMVAKIISPITWPVYVVLGYTMLCLGFFTLRSLKYIILPEGYSTLEPSARQRRVQFLFLVSAVQIFLSSVMVIWSTTKTAQKLTLFPAEREPSADIDVQPDNITQLPHVTAKTQQERWLSRLEKKWLPRVTAYCTANSYKMDELLDFLKTRSIRNRTSPKQFDEAIHTPYMALPVNTLSPEPTPLLPDLVNLSSEENLEGDRPDALLDNVDSFFEQNIDSAGRSLPSNIPYDSLAKRIAPVGECVFFAYGVVVMWGLSEREEQMVLKELEPFEEDKLSDDDIEVEEFCFHYNVFYQPRIYNDIITLKNPANYMIKLTISHAIAQSVKLALFEGRIEETIESTKHVPQILAETGKIHMTRKSVNKKIGQLFIMRINVNLVSNVLDVPEIFWSEPALTPLYTAIRGYLEINQRVDLLNQRVSVISDLLDMLKEHQTSSHGEQLEWIVIILIAFEIVIGIITISFDLSSYMKFPEAGGAKVANLLLQGASS